MNFFGIMRKYLVPFSLICAMFPTFPTMSGAQGVFFTNLWDLCPGQR